MGRCSEISSPRGDRRDAVTRRSRALTSWLAPPLGVHRRDRAPRIANSLFGLQDRRVGLGDLDGTSWPMCAHRWAGGAGLGRGNVAAFFFMGDRTALDRVLVTSPTSSSGCPTIGNRTPGDVDRRRPPATVTRILGGDYWSSTPGRSVLIGGTGARWTVDFPRPDVARPNPRLRSVPFHDRLRGPYPFPERQGDSRGAADVDGDGKP